MDLEDFDFPEVDADILVLAGDIDNGTDGVPKILDISDRYESVFYVLGNHEYYGQDVNTLREDIRKGFENSNVTVLIDRLDNLKRNAGTNEEQILTIAGTTLWTDFFEEDIKEMQSARMFLRDFNGEAGIMIGGEKYTVEDSVSSHNESVELLKWFQEAESMANHLKLVVTHHLPSAKLIDPKFANSAINGSFASKKDDLFKGINLWMCGHTHESFDEVINDCRVVINPRGYPHEENGFNPELVIEI